MLNSIRLLIALLLFVLVFTAPHTAFTVPKSPLLESKIGYLNVEKNVSLPPVAERLFIQPKVELLILRNEKDAYILVYSGEKYSTVCLVPKYAKYTLLMSRDKTGRKLSFRGALEVDTVPIELREGEELPIKERERRGYVVFVKRNDQILPFFVADDLKNLRFEMTSVLAKFAKKQRRKGLRCVDGVWMRADKATAVLLKKRKEAAENARIWKGIERGAKRGVVILKNGEILHGKVVGKVSSHLFFLAAGRYHWIGLQDVNPISYNRIIMRGNIDHAERLLDKAEELMQSDMGIARKHIHDASLLVGEIPERDLFEKKQAEKINENVLKMTKRIERKLQDEHKVIYDYTVFRDYVVDYHLNLGHILLKRKYWIKPEQRCDKCHTKGSITCPKCNGKGKVSNKCHVCDGKGRVRCPKCNGTGWRECYVCGGKGYVYRKARRRSYASFGMECYYPIYWRPGTVVAMGNSIMAVGPTPVFGRGCFSGVSIGSREGGAEAVQVVCEKCGGRGTLRCPKTRKCGNCDGSGVVVEICAECKGEKSVTCPKCRGKGFTGEIQSLPKHLTPNRLLP